MDGIEQVGVLESVCVSLVADEGAFRLYLGCTEPSRI